MQPMPQDPRRMALMQAMMRGQGGMAPPAAPPVSPMEMAPPPIPAPPIEGMPPGAPAGGMPPPLAPPMQSAGMIPRGPYQRPVGPPPMMGSGGMPPAGAPRSMWNRGPRGY